MQAQKQEKLPPQYLFVSNRDVEIASTLGYALSFTKGEPLHVPRAMHSAVMERGCQPCDKDGKPVDPSAENTSVMEEKPVFVEPEDADERAEKITAAIRQLYKRNKPADFSGGGVPRPDAVAMITGWRTDVKEIRPIWDRLKPELVKA